MDRSIWLGYRGSEFSDGSASISGTVYKTDVGGPHIVLLLDNKTFRVLRKTRADISGTYVFDNIPLKVEQYLLLGLDRTGSELTPGVSDFVSSSGI
jgi:hypothetical protein